jgi:hypothetical protein
MFLSCLIQGTIWRMQGRESRWQRTFADVALQPRELLNRFRASHNGCRSKKESGAKHRSKLLMAFCDKTVRIPQVGDRFTHTDPRTCSAGKRSQTVGSAHGLPMLSNGSSVADRHRLNSIRNQSKFNLTGVVSR